MPNLVGSLKSRLNSGTVVGVDPLAVILTLDEMDVDVTPDCCPPQLTLGPLQPVQVTPGGAV